MTDIEDIENGNYLVQKEPFYMAQGNEIELFTMAYGLHMPILLKGPTGSGKTRLVEHMAYKLNRPLYTVACNEDLTANDLTGRYIIKGDEVVWIDGPLLMAVKTGGIAYLDEIVEARKDVTVVIHPLTDHRRLLPVEKLGKQFIAPDEFMLVMSYNPNYQNILKELKPSTKQRFACIEIGWPKAELEVEIIKHEANTTTETSQILVKLGNQIRKLKNEGLEEGVSTRELIYAANLMREGIDPISALISTLVEPLTNDEDMKTTIKSLIDNYYKNHV